MALNARPSLLQRLLGLSSAAQDEDPADMGTAIGLDFMLDQAPLPETASTAHDGSETARHDWQTRGWAR